MKYNSCIVEAMNLPLAVVVLLTAFVVSLGVASLRVRRATQVLSLLVSGALLEGSASWTSGAWGVDNVSRLAVAVVVIVGVSVGVFAWRQFEGERRAPWIMAASMAVIAAALASALAHSLLWMTLSWLATSLATIAVVALSTPRGSSAARLVRSLLLADIPLAVVVAWIVLHQGDLALRPSPQPLLSPALSVAVFAAGTVSTFARAGFTTRRSWVTETVQAPTSVSALLHAGVVNGGALLMWRLGALGPFPVVGRALAALACGAVMVALAPRITRRVDLKGQLALSTVSQMAFMMLAIELGWWTLALTHLAGHALYKAYRFQDAGGAIAARARWRRAEHAGFPLTTTNRVSAVAALCALAVAIGVAAPPESRAVDGVFAVAALAVWWSSSRRPFQHPVILVLALSATLVAYCAAVAGAQIWLESSTGADVAAPWWSLGATVAVTALLAKLRRRPAVQRAPRRETVRLFEPVGVVR